MAPVESADATVDRLLVLDLEFSYLSLLQKSVADAVNSVIRSSMANHPPVFTNAEGGRVESMASPGATAVYHQDPCVGQVLVDVVGTWENGFGSHCV